jgi:hypothetical protein
MSTPIDVYKTTPKEDKEPRKVYVDVVQVKDIPGAMDNMGWKVAARMMRQWFANPLHVMPSDIRSGKNVDYAKLPASQVNDSILTMQWFLGFERGRAAVEEALRTWKTPKAIKRLKDLLKKHGWQPGMKDFLLGYGLTTAIDLETHCQVNYHEIGDYRDRMDDLFGAVFKATVKIAVVGHAMHNPIDERDFFVVERYGLYLRDTYDFNAEWYEDIPFSLGVWSKERCLSKKEIPLYLTSWVPHEGGWVNDTGEVFRKFVGVNNADFRRYQNVNKTGGDFFAFSDVLWVQGGGEHVDLSDLF